MCIEQTENCFRLNPQVFANNYVKLHNCIIFLTVLTLIACIHTWYIIVKRESLMLCARFDGNSLTMFKVLVRKLLVYFFVDTVDKLLAASGRPSGENCSHAPEKFCFVSGHI